MDDRVVPEVRPRVVHVEEGHVDAIWISGRHGVLEPDIVEEVVFQVDVATDHVEVSTRSGSYWQRSGQASVSAARMMHQTGPAANGN